MRQRFCDADSQTKTNFFDSETGKTIRFQPKDKPPHSVRTVAPAVWWFFSERYGVTENERGSNK